MTFSDRLASMRKRDDSGAALVLALIFITVIALAIAAVLSFADTNIRATVKLREQAADVAAAEGAAQIAIDQLRHGNYAGGANCFGGSNQLSLSGYYQPPAATVAQQALVTCTQDSTTSFNSYTTRPTYALLTQPTVTTEHGIEVKPNGPGSFVFVDGRVGSATDITGALHASGDVLSLIESDDCRNGVVVAISPAVKNCKAGSLPGIPTYSPPPWPGPGTTPPAGTITPTKCDKNATTITFTAGYYDSITPLSNAMACNFTQIYDFRPGVYYFTFDSTKKQDIWTVDHGTMVAGKATPVTGTPNVATGVCESQIDNTTVDPTKGATFIFSDKARWLVTKDAQVELCGTRYQQTAPPVSIYGLSGPLTAGTKTFQPLAGCTIDPANHCGFLQTDQNTSSNSKLYVRGLVYATTGFLDLDMRKSTDQYFKDGVYVRAVSMFSPASTAIPTPVASVPATSPGPTTTDVYLEVRMCPTSPCTAASGTVRLRAKVGLIDPTGLAGGAQRQVRIYSWSVQR
jgi:hypothetical protein